MIQLICYYLGKFVEHYPLTRLLLQDVGTVFRKGLWTPMNQLKYLEKFYLAF